jgi:nucleotide-binding universal stress UspA family protein
VKNKILVAVDGSETSTKGVEYVGDIFGECEKEVDITLYHVLEVPPMFLEHGGTVESAKEMQEQVEAWQGRETDRVEKEIFDPAMRILKEKSNGKEGMRIQAKLADVAYPEVALVIIEEVKEGGYDTLVLGRRGLSMLKEFIFGSLTYKLVHHIHGCTIWIVE